MKKTLVGLMACLLLGSLSCNKSCNQQKAPESAKLVPAQTAPDANKTEPQHEAKEEPKGLKMGDFDLKPGEKLYATFETTEGDMKAELYWEKAPETVRNFVELATGKKEWTHPKTQEKSSKPLYDGTIFHRVIKGFMIQGGDPMGTGFGGPGYKFKDEFHPELRHNAIGILSMANSGPNTNGSQFFITEGPTPHLDNRHTVFGKLADEKSLEVLKKIAGTKTDTRDKPATDVVIKHVKIAK